MKVLTICERGNSRSVCLAHILKDIGHDALAMGILSASEETKEMLFEWAEKIILVDKRFEDKIPEKYKGKLVIYDVGPDRYFMGHHPELDQMFKNYLQWNPI